MHRTRANNLRGAPAPQHQISAGSNGLQGAFDFLTNGSTHIHVQLSQLLQYLKSSHTKVHETSWGKDLASLHKFCSTLSH
eukprot:3230564-Amphidinium_carterae.1